MFVSRPAGELRDGAWTFLADLDPALFYWGPRRSVNRKAIAREAKIAHTCLVKLAGGSQPLTRHVADALVALAVSYDRPGRRVSEARARRALFTGEAATVRAPQAPVAA